MSHMTYKEYQEELQESQRLVEVIRKELQKPETMSVAIQVTKKSYDLVWSHRLFPVAMISIFETMESFLKEVQSRPIFSLLDGLARFMKGVGKFFGFELKPSRKVFRRLFPQTVKRYEHLMKTLMVINTEIAGELLEVPEFQKYMKIMEKLADRF